MANIQKWELHFQSDPVKVRQVVRDILMYLDEALPGQSAEERGDLKLVFNELLYNAVIHGNQRDLTKYVYLELTVFDSHVRASIRDEGTGFNYQAVTEQAFKTDDFQKETGRGLKLVLALMDEVTFNLSGNQIFFAKHIKNKT